MPTSRSEVELLGQRLRQRRCACRVVRGVDENRWGAAHPLQPPWTDCGGEPRTNSVDIELPVRPCAEERFDGGQRDDGVVRLMVAMQRQEDLGVHPAESLQFEHLAADRHLPAQHRELGVLPSHGGVGSHRLGQHHFHRLGQLPADHRDGVDRHEVVLLVGDDSRLLRGDFGDLVAEVLGVVDTDRGDDGHRCVDDVGGVPATAHPDLDDRDVDRRVGEGRERHPGDHLFMAVCESACRQRYHFHSINPGQGQGNDQGDSVRGPGSLKFTGNYTPVGSPSGMVFLI